jgi:hypothetical protein
MSAILEDSPSRYLVEIFEQTYQTARCEAEIVIGVQPLKKCGWTIEQVRSDMF